AHQETMYTRDADRDGDHVVPVDRETEAQGGEGARNLDLSIQRRHGRQGSHCKLGHARADHVRLELVDLPVRAAETYRQPIIDHICNSTRLDEL
ncbi:MAG: hypothetical protein Q9212_004784, partial [Teloschistes hypoglaucus]